jgi:transposase
MEARDERRLLKLQAQLAAVKLLIVDELGYVPLSQAGAELPESRVRPGCEILAISAGAAAVRLALRPCRKVAWFCYAPLADFYSAVDNETWAKTNMGPLRGWAPRGQHLPGQVPYGHWKTMTLLAALRCDRIDAPWVLDGPINGESFRVYVERVLVPALAQGDIVVMDNLGSHKGKAIRRIGAAGARLFLLPPYSPDLNPIEQVFAKLKHFLRKAAERTASAPWRRIGTLLDDFSPDECANYFVNSGYASV